MLMVEMLVICCEIKEFILLDQGGQNKVDLKTKTDQDIEIIKKEYMENKATVIDMLVERIMDVKIQFP